jgi:hypothetical protein
MELKWETIQISSNLQTRTDRLKVVGGWLVKTLTVVTVSENGATHTEVKVNMCFLADPTHHWVCQSSGLPLKQAAMKNYDKPKKKAKKKKARR